MKILLLGYESDHLKIIDYIRDKTTVIDVVGYDGVIMNTKVNKKSLDNIKISDYKIIFLSDYLTEKEMSLFDDYKDDDVLLFKGLKWIEAGNIRNEQNALMVNNIVQAFAEKVPYSIDGSNVFIIGYDQLGFALAEQLQHMGSSVRVGTTSKRELDILVNQRINTIYATNMAAIKMLIDANEVVINTVKDLDIDETDANFINRGNYVIDINDLNRSCQKKL